MNTQDKLKQIVKDKYGKIALSNNSGCCGSSGEPDYSIFNDDYSKLDGYTVEADLNLGCGIPTEFAGIKEGNTVLDLGCGAGNDVFVARQLVGDSGKVIGLDFTEEMIAKAKANNQKLGYDNVEFYLGDIEEMPFEQNSIDVIISNCVLNLVPNKQKAFAEIYRTLTPGGHFCVSDIVIKGEISDELRASAELYAGCVTGAMNEDEYIGLIKETGFVEVEIKKSKEIVIPDSMLESILSEQEIDIFKNSFNGIFSITVVGKKNSLK